MTSHSVTKFVILDQWQSHCIRLPQENRKEYMESNPLQNVAERN